MFLRHFQHGRDHQRCLNGEHDRKAYEKRGMARVVAKSEHTERSAERAADEREEKQRRLRNSACPPPRPRLIEAHDGKEHKVYRREIEEKNRFYRHFRPDLPPRALLFGFAPALGFGLAQPDLYSGFARLSPAADGAAARGAPLAERALFAPGTFPP